MEQKKYKVVKNLLEEETCLLLATQIKVKKVVADFKYVNLKETIKQGDGQVNNAFAIEKASITEALLLLLNEKANKVFDKKLVPTYSYCRIYYQEATMPLHVDRPACEYSITICLQKDELYPIIMGGESIELEIGDAVFYKGCEVRHERKAYKGKEHIQVFLHYVEEGSDLIYDKRKWVGM